MSNDRKGLERAILEAPADDAPRLALADWFDENATEDNGFAGKAELIRLGVELERTHNRDSKKEYVSREHGKLLTDRIEFLMGGPAGQFDIDTTTVWPIVVRRGFVAEITLACEAFMTHAAELFSKHPIERVTLSDKNPDDAYWWWRDQDDRYPANRAYLPTAIFDLMKSEPHGTEGSGLHYSSRELAVTELSDACILYGRKLVGLTT